MRSYREDLNGEWTVRLGAGDKVVSTHATEHKAAQAYDLVAIRLGLETVSYNVAFAQVVYYNLSYC